VSTLLTTEAMRALNADIQLNGRQPAEVAEKFLTANRILQ
jgi:glycine betaine/choline ABC-type transport system substrate-binding protein